MSEPQDATRAELRPAATVIVARPGEEGVEVLMVRRGSANRFAPGYVVFPGGVVDPGDRDLAREMFGVAGESTRAAGLRELYEETGLLLTGMGFRVHPAPRVPLADLSFPAPDPAALVEIARWVAPRDLPMRFDARFYAAAASPGHEPAPDGVEADRAWWARPQDILDRRQDAPLMWPTVATLEALVGCRTVEEVLHLRIPQAPRPDRVPPPPAPGGPPSPRIVRVLANNPGAFTLEGTNTWIVGSDPSVVIDPGPDDPAHLEEVRRVADPIGAILLTHRHPDHAPGAAPLAKAADARVYAYRPEPGELPLAHGQEIEVGETRLVVGHTPGHTPDHVVFFLPGERALFTGDAVLGRGTSVIDPPEGDLAAYLHSLRRMRDLEPSRLYPGHGPVVWEAVGKLDEYLAHRAMREEQVLAALEDRERTPEEMVPEIYGEETPPQLRAAAARSVLAHLLKLEREGRVAHAGREPSGRFAAVEPRECERCGRPAAPRSRLCRRCSLAALQEEPER